MFLVHQNSGRIFSVLKSEYDGESGARTNGTYTFELTLQQRHHTNKYNNTGQNE